MTIVLNKCYGGFDLSKEFTEKYPQFDNATPRDNKDFIQSLIEFGIENASASYAKLTIVGIENATDWMITENDGFERLIYVVDGKILQK